MHQHSGVANHHQSEHVRHDHDHQGGHDDHDYVAGWNDFARIPFVGIAVMAVWLRLWEPFPRVSVIGIIATIMGGWPIFKEAFENVIERRMTMELSMTIALLAALLIGDFRTVLVIIFFVLIAEVLEGLTVGRGRQAINQSGVLEIKVTGIGRDTAFGRIIEAVERAEKVRAPIQKTADRLAGYVVYFALGCALLTLAITRDDRYTNGWQGACVPSKRGGDSRRKPRIRPGQRNRYH